MSTIQVTREWQPEPAKNLVKSIPVKEGKKLSKAEKKALEGSHLCVEDLMGLSWVLFDNLVDDV